MTARAGVYVTMMGSLPVDRWDTAQITGISMRQPFSQYQSILLIGPNSYHVQSPGTAAPESNAHIVFSARTICNANLHDNDISCANSKN